MMRHKLIALFLSVWVLFMMPMAVSAQELLPDHVGSISVTLMDRDGKTPITGAELSLYYVATVCMNDQNHLSYTFTDTFKNCGSALDDPALALTLDAFVTEHDIPAVKLVTDPHGTAAFTDLPLGLYLVKQTGAAPGYALCSPFLVTVPSGSTDGFVYDVNASPKTDIARLTNITVRKVWNTDASAKAADRVTVQLLRDGVVVQTAELHEQNKWQVTYRDMPESDAYSIVEVNVPTGFTATYSQIGYVFTVTNTASLAQTGQLFWPIPVLALVGLCLITVGSIVLMKQRNKNA